MNRNATQVEITINNWLTFDAESTKNYSDGINEIYQGKIDGILLKGIFSQAEMLAVTHKLENKNYQLEAVGYGTTLGYVLAAASGKIDKYLRTAANFRSELKRLFNTNFEARVEATLSQMSGGRKVELARENDERIYTPATFRFLHPNRGGIGLHRDNEFLVQPSYQYLNKVAKMVNSLSYFIIVDTPEKGGDLVLYDVPVEQSETRIKDLDLEKCPKKIINTNIGDMILFRGGNILHQVTPDVEGRKTRITIGGFLAISKDDQKIFYWS
ncbi:MULTISPECIES: 2OG-Fe(II) oxygenase [unclassified Anabaena]|uniref:2OG-Fe(II) oxygenase n=1 Tax=unclassified Anabaena TaxID=2619674 RepID=UPI0039C74597